MEDDGQLEKLLTLLDAAVTAEKRVTALQSIQSYILEVEELSHTDQLTAALKLQLKNQNHLVSSLALKILPIYVSKLADSNHHNTRAQDVKTLVLANLSIILEKLGDQKEKVREGAKAATVEMARAYFSVSPAGSTMTKDPQTAVAIFERVFKESGLSAKSAKVKEQATLTLIPLRKAIDKFPLRPFLPALVDQLSDADPGVREAARTTCISLFSGATPTAKSELKKEMEKKAVRKQTADAILAQVVGAGVEADAVAETKPSSSAFDMNLVAASLHDGEGTGPRPPPRSASRLANADTADDGIKAIYIASQWDLERTMTSMLPCFEGKETEHNWLAREQSVVKLRGMLKTGTHENFPDGFLAGLKQIHEGILKATASLRTTLSMHGLQLISELAQKMRENLDSLAEPLIASIIKMAGFTKKIVANASQSAVHEILVHVTYRHKFLDLIWQNLQEKMVTTRAFMCGHLLTILETHGVHRKHTIEGHGGLEIIENFCKKAVPDQNKDVREKARLAFYKVETIWPAVAAQILHSLDAATRKQIDSNRALLSQSNSNMRAGVGNIAKASPASVPRKSAAPGPSSAILAAKRAAAARLAQERRNREEAEAAAQLQDESEEVDEPPPVSTMAVDFTSREFVEDSDGENRLRQEAENEVEADTSQQLMEESELGDFVDQTPRKNALVTFPPLPSPKSPLRSSSVGSSNGQGHARTLTPSSIPLPVSPRSTLNQTISPQQGEGSQATSKSSLRSSSSPSNAGLMDSRSRTVSTSSTSSVRSVGRLGATANVNPGGRFESFGQRVNHSPAGPLPPSRNRTSSGSSSSNKGKASVSSPALRNRPVSMAIPSRGQHSTVHSLEEDETVQLDPFPDASMDLLSSNTDFEIQDDSLLPSSASRNESIRVHEDNGKESQSRLNRNQASPIVRSINPSTPFSARTPTSSSTTERSRLPRPVSVMYQGTSPLSSALKHAHSRSIDTDLVPTSPTLASRNVQPMQASIVATSNGESDRSKGDKVNATSSRIKWFLGKASRLEHSSGYEREAEGEEVDIQLSPVKKRPESEVWISQLQSGQADVRTFKGLASICKEFKLPQGSRDEVESEELLQPGKLLSRSSLGLIEVDHYQKEEQIAINMWQHGNLFERLFTSLSTFLTVEPSSSGPTKDLKTAALIVLHRLVENQFKLFEVLGKERDLIQLVFELIKANKTSSVKSACQAIMETWSDQTNVIMGISTLRGISSTYLGIATSASPSSTMNTSTSIDQMDNAKSDSSNAFIISIHTLSLRSLARLFQKLPSELVEEEVQKCKVIVKKGLNHWNIETRQQAVAVLVAANGKVKDPKSLFSILQPMDRAQEDLLMYYMNK